MAVRRSRSIFPSCDSPLLVWCFGASGGIRTHFKAVLEAAAVPKLLQGQFN